MTDDISLRILRTTVFSLVVPHKEPCNAYKIRMDYKEMEGEDIPFADYGHRNLDEFLLAHPMLSGMMQDGKWVFTARMSDRSANIQALVKGQKGKKRKPKKGSNNFTRNGTRNSYHGKPTLGNGDVRRGNGPQFFNRNTPNYRSFNAGAPRPPIAPDVKYKVFNSKNTNWNQQDLTSRPNSSAHKMPISRPSSSVGWPSQQSMANSQPSRPFTPTFNPTRVYTRFFFILCLICPHLLQSGPQEGMRRFNAILTKCKGVATLRVFCRLYAQEFKVPFGADELKSHFSTVDLTDILNKYGNDKILVNSTPDGSVMFTDSQVIEAHTRAAREMEEKKKNSVVIEPEKKHCTIPSLKVMYDELTEMLVESFPDGILVEDITSRYMEKAEVAVDPVAVFAFSWSELIVNKFNSRIKILNGKTAVLTPTYIKANNLRVRAPGERRKQELVTLNDLGIIFVDESSVDDDEYEEEDEESNSENTSFACNDLNRAKNTWRNAPSVYGSTCSSVASSVQCLTANLSPTQDTQDMIETVISEEVDELADLMRTVKVEVDQDCPRMVTINSNSGVSLPKLNILPPLNRAEKGEKEEKVVKSSQSFFSKFSARLPFANTTRYNVNHTSHPTVTFIPPGELKVDANGSYNSFSLNIDADEKYAVQVNCKSAYFRLLGSTCIPSPRKAKLLQVIREEGPKGDTPVTIDFVKLSEGEKRPAGDIMKSATPTFSLEYTFIAE